MFKATNLVEQALKNVGIKCRALDLGKASFVEGGFTGDNCTVKIRAISTDDDNDVKIMTEEFTKIPMSKLTEGYGLMNDLNRKYKYFKFCIDPKDGAVSAQADVPISVTDEQLGKVAVEYVLRCSKIVDDAYPQIMRMCWG